MSVLAKYSIPCRVRRRLLLLVLEIFGRERRIRAVTNSEYISFAIGNNQQLHWSCLNNVTIYLKSMWTNLTSCISSLPIIRSVLKAVVHLLYQGFNLEFYCRLCQSKLWSYVFLWFQIDFPLSRWIEVHCHCLSSHPVPDSALLHFFFKFIIFNIFVQTLPYLNCLSSSRLFNLWCFYLHTWHCRMCICDVLDLWDGGQCLETLWLSKKALFTLG